MPYGHPSSTGHGYRPTRYRWYPSFDPISPRHRRPTHRHGRSRLGTSRNRSPVPSSLGFLDAIDWAFRGGRFPNWFRVLMESVTLIAMVVNFPVFFLFLLKPLLEGGIGPCVEDPEKDMLSSLDKISRAIRIQRKTSVDPPPKPEAIRAAWGAARRSLEGKLLAGTLLSNLEPVVDQSYIRDEDGTIIGRKAGIKGWLATNCPDMLPHYKALMNYKALADKLRMSLGVKEPDTLLEVLDLGQGETDGTVASGQRKQPNEADATTGESSDRPKSLQVIEHIILLKSNTIDVVKKIDDLNASLYRAGRTTTMASLDVVLREQLGLVWMRRKKRDNRAA